MNLGCDMKCFLGSKSGRVQKAHHGQRRTSIDLKDGLEAIVLTYQQSGKMVKIMESQGVKNNELIPIEEPPLIALSGGMV